MEHEHLSEQHGQPTGVFNSEGIPTRYQNETRNNPNEVVEKNNNGGEPKSEGSSSLEGIFDNNEDTEPIDPNAGNKPLEYEMYTIDQKSNSEKIKKFLEIEKAFISNGWIGTNKKTLDRWIANGFDVNTQKFLSVATISDGIHHNEDMYYIKAVPDTTPAQLPESLKHNTNISINFFLIHSPDEATRDFAIISNKNPDNVQSYLIPVQIDETTGGVIHTIDINPFSGLTEGEINDALNQSNQALLPPQQIRIQGINRGERIPIQVSQDRLVNTKGRKGSGGNPNNTEIDETNPNTLETKTTVLVNPVNKVAE